MEKIYCFKIMQLDSQIGSGVGTGDGYGLGVGHGFGTESEKKCYKNGISSQQK